MIKARPFNVLILIALLISFEACNKNNPFDSGEKLDITLVQRPDSMGSRLMLFFQKGEYNCVNVRMKYTFQKGNSIVINIGENYLEGDSCKSPTTTGLTYPAREGVDLGHLNVGTYALKIIHQGNTGTGVIIVTTEYFSVSLSNEYFAFNNNKTTLNRIPIDAVWGGFYSWSNASIDQELFDTLKHYGAVNYAPLLPIGDCGFGYFYISEDHSFTLWGYGTGHDFLYKVNIDSTNLSNIRNYISQKYFGATPYFETGKGFRVGG